MDAYFKDWICFWLVYSQFTVVNSASSRPEQFKKNSRLEGYLPFTGFLYKSTTRSVIDCSRKCSKDSQCVSFFFVENTSLCQTHDEFVVDMVVDMAGLQEMATTVYYTMADTCTSVGHLDTPSCYVIIPALRNWATAKDNCEKIGAHLAYISTIKELIVIKSLFRLRHPSTYKYLWVGADNREVEGVFLWLDGSPLMSSLWGAQRPDNYQGQEDCVSLHTTYFVMDDKSCVHKYWSVCEFGDTE